MKAACVLLALELACASCASNPPADPRYPPLPEGCSVKVFPDAPGVPTDNLGPVRATCTADVSDADCLRTLEDQVCRLGGDVVWGVPSTPTKTDSGSNRWSGRAAHTKAQPAARSPAP
jgi:hypothetical protein